jgi:hypothetical protein
MAHVNGRDYNAEIRALRKERRAEKRAARDQSSKPTAGAFIVALVGLLVIGLLALGINLSNGNFFSASGQQTSKPAASSEPAKPNTPVGEADGITTHPPVVPVSQPTQPDVDRRLTELGYGSNAGWTRNITNAAWADIANNNPGLMAVGTSFAKTPAEAAAAAANNPTVKGTYAEKANPANWVLVYNPQCMRYDAMAYQLPDGTFAWGSGFVECGVMVWVNTVSGGQFRLLCDNGLHDAPLPTVEKPSMPEVHPNPKLTPPVGTTVTPPTGTTINYPNPPTEECVKPASPGPGYTWDQENCKWTPPTTEECVKPTSPGPGYTWDEENCKWCPPVEECVQPESPGEGYTWNEEECKWTPPTTEECVQPESPGEGYTWDQENCKWTPPTIDECVQPESPGEGWTWDEENCKWCPPVEECVQPESPGPGYTWDEENCKWTPPAVEECKPGIPVGDSRCDKDPSQDPEQTGNAPDNGTPMPDPGPATDPAVPESEAPDTYTPPAPPAPVVDTPRPPEEIPVNEGAGPETPVEGTVDEGVCEVCGGGMDTEAVQAAVVAPAAAASAPAVEDNQAAAQAEANRVAAEQQAAAQAEANRVAAEQAAAQQAAAEKAAAAQAAQQAAAAQAAAEAQAQATAQAKAQAAAEQQAIAKAQADAAAKAQAEAQAKAQADAQKAQQQEVATQVAKHTPSKGDSAKGAKTSNNVG